MNLIPIGTLCTLVGLQEAWTERDEYVGPADRFNGITCTVDGYNLGDSAGCTHKVRFPRPVLVRPGYVARAAFARRECLIPIAPPGDPDGVDTPTTIPEEIGA